MSELFRRTKLDAKFHAEIVAEIQPDEVVLNVQDAFVSINDTSGNECGIVVTSSRLLILTTTWRGKLSPWRLRWAGLHGMREDGPFVKVVFNDNGVTSLRFHIKDDIERELLLTTINEGRTFEELKKSSIVENEMDELRKLRGF